MASLLDWINGLVQPSTPGTKIFATTKAPKEERWAAVQSGKTLPVRSSSPSSAAPPAGVTSTKLRSPSSGGSSGSGGGSRSGGGGGGGGGGGAPKSTDAPQLAALQRMIDSEFARARDTKVGNITALLATQDAEVLRGYDERVAQLLGSRRDNDMAEGQASFANVANRVRERADLLLESAAQGAGETDTLRTMMQALRNWQANQADVNRSFFDTERSVNNAITDLNADTRSARINLASQAQRDQEQAWSNYYNQLADAYTQMGNIHANPYSDSHKPGSDAFSKAAEAAGSSWQAPGVSPAIREWSGTASAVESRLNNSAATSAVTNLAEQRPEGATLRRW